MIGRSRNSKLPLFVVLAAIFTVALTFVTVEGPTLLNRVLADYLGIPDFNPAIESELIEEFMNSYYLKPVGYAFLAVLVVLIIAGFFTKRTRLSTLGTIAFFLPTFGSFARYMFFLSGIGILRLVWLPIWGPSANLLRLGDIVYLPYMIVAYSLSLLFSLIALDPNSPLTLTLKRSRMTTHYWDAFHVDVRVPLAYAVTGLGLFILLLGTITWLHTKFQKRETADFWIYRHSRHPQYLGWLIWSYGLMLLASYTPVPLGGVNPGASFSWVISTLLVICVALTEEIKMTEKYGEAYIKYRDTTSFMLPLPSFVCSAITLPVRVLLEKSRPENGKEIIATFLVYAAIIVLLSLPFVLLNWPSGLGWSEWPYNMWPFKSPSPFPHG